MKLQKTLKSIQLTKEEREDKGGSRSRKSALRKDGEKYRSETLPKAMKAAKRRNLRTSRRRRKLLM